MKIIALSSPSPIPGEYETINWLLEQGVDRFHIRRPNSSLDLIEDSLNKIPDFFKCNTSVHSHHDEVKNMDISVGLHHTSDSSFDTSFNGIQSKSFHSIEEIKNNKHPYSYAFLSPIFPSISKPGYKADFLESDLQEMNESSGFPIFALGGVSVKTVLKAKKLGFSGIVLMGVLWEEENIAKMKEHVRKVINVVKS